MFGVLSRSASAKHGKEFAHIVTSFNKDNLTIERADAPNNYINVDVNQTNERLDKVEYQLIKLNRHFGGKKEVHDLGDVRIEKIGNKTRIIRK
jgi:archaellum component FlaC